MRRSSFRWSCVLVLVLSSVLNGCGSSTAATSTGGTAASETSRSAEPTSVVLAVVDPPKMSTTDYLLPPGCGVDDFTESLAAYEQWTSKEYPVATIGLLDLASGNYRTVLPTPVGAAEKFDAFSPRLSDNWLVWEEVSPDEGYDMGNATWRLYTAPIDRESLSIGEPMLVDTGDTSIVARPFYNAWGDEIVWARLTWAVSGQEAPVIHSEIMALDAVTGTERVVARSDNAWHAVNFSGGCAIATELVDRESAEYAAVTIDLKTGQEVQRVFFTARHGVSHVAERVGERTFWAAFPNRESVIPSLFCADASGAVTKIRPSSMDGCGVGSYLFCESNLQEGKSATDDSFSAIVGVDMENRTTWFLDKTNDGLWQLPAQTGWHEDTLIGSLDSGTVVDGEVVGQTLVRRWVLGNE